MTTWLTTSGLAARLLAREPKNGEFLIVAIDGRGGSGKSTLSEDLAKLLPGFLLLHGDDYFDPTPEGPAWGDFNERRFEVDVLEPLRTGPDFVHRPYAWHTEPPITDLPVRVQAGIVIERCFSMALDLDWDVMVWVETPADLCLQRGLARDLVAGDEAARVWRDVWQPREDDYIQRVRPLLSATYVIDGTSTRPS